MLSELRAKLKVAARVDVSRFRQRTPPQAVVKPKGQTALAVSTDKVVAIGASTGGTEAIREVVVQLPRTTPGVVIVQHMPAGFTKMFADRLNQLSQMDVKEAEDGDRVMTGRVLVAPGGKHMRVVRAGGIYSVEIRAGELVCGHCPSVEVMMQSVSRSVGANAVGVMLTGMGHDGADGMKAMRDAGARTLAQDEKSCVVFGMPKVAYERGGAERLVPLSEVANSVLRLLAGAGS